LCVTDQTIPFVIFLPSPPDAHVSSSQLNTRALSGCSFRTRCGVVHSVLFLDKKSPGLFPPPHPRLILSVSGILQSRRALPLRSLVTASFLYLPRRCCFILSEIHAGSPSLPPSSLVILSGSPARRSPPSRCCFLLQIPIFLVLTEVYKIKAYHASSYPISSFDARGEISSSALFTVVGPEFRLVCSDRRSVPALLLKTLPLSLGIFRSDGFKHKPSVFGCGPPG